MNEQMDKMLQAVIDWLLTVGLNVLSAAIIILLSWWVIKILCKTVRKILSRANIDGSAVGFIISIMRAVLWIIAVLFALGKIINVNSMIAALGAAGLTASFALQGSLSNFVSGLQIVFSKPFTVGDYLSVEGHEGSVSRMDMLNTTLLSIDNKEVIIPNSKITSGVVINYTAQKTRRLDLVYTVAYDTDLAVPKKILADMIEKEPRMLKEPAPVVAVGKHLSSSIEVLARAWVSTDDYWPVYWDMQEKVKNAFDQNGVNIPFPQLDVHTKQQVEK